MFKFRRKKRADEDIFKFDLDDIAPEKKRGLTMALTLFFALFFVILAVGSYLLISSRLSRPSVPEGEIKITIYEGVSTRDMAGIFANAGLFGKDDFIKAAAPYEGYLFPDTYRFYRSSTPTDVVLKMKKNFEEKITAEMKAEIEQRGHTLEEVVIMASILEKEVAKDADRKIVSGILWKRLEIGMGLQVDATLDYILNKTSSELTQDDLKIDSPYNTYLYRGLPKGPISSPGLGSIDAAINPTVTNYLFYLSDPEGNMHYAVDFEGHKLNKIKFIK
ncbi:endolytic transglycosylase MltG [Candidatus Giovannonibacteria bacterium]|nr:endolytic transglycosylase MltG [Candidatus Giovannonibacteria bacterium]